MNVACGGWRFVKLQTEFDSNLDEIVSSHLLFYICIHSLKSMFHPAIDSALVHFHVELLYQIFRVRYGC